MGVKGFAWIGGFTLFLGIVFAIQYCFAHHLLSRELQAGCGFLIGLAVLAGGVVMSRKNPRPFRKLYARPAWSFFTR